jgi:hypothetical protein
MLSTGQKKKHMVSKIGVVLGYLGLVMGFVGICGFSGSLPNYLDIVGKYCFLCWFPTFLIGILLSFYPNKKINSD